MATEENSIETVIAEAVKAKVQTMVVDALGEPGELVRKIVAEALTQTVQVGDRYRPENVTMITKMVRESVIEEGTKVMKQFILDQREAIQAELLRHLTANKKEIAAALIGSLVKTAGNSYSLRLVFETKES
jgi:hypothetical protein